MPKIISCPSLHSVLHVKKKNKKNLGDCPQSESYVLIYFKWFEVTYWVPISVQVNLRDGIWPTSVCVFTHVSVCLVCVSLPCLAPILAALRTLPCIRKHAGVGLESRSGLENNVGTLLRLDFLLSLALCYPSPKATARSHPSCLSRPTCNELLEHSAT